MGTPSAVATRRIDTTVRDQVFRLVPPKLLNTSKAAEAISL
ncbi:hypothetical protein ACIBKY_54600 [Nonomuraea sp. NPDC050394]